MEEDFDRIEDAQTVDREQTEQPQAETAGSNKSRLLSSLINEDE